MPMTACAPRVWTAKPPRARYDLLLPARSCLHYLFIAAVLARTRAPGTQQAEHLRTCAPGACVRRSHARTPLRALPARAPAAPPGRLPGGCTPGAPSAAAWHFTACPCVWLLLFHAPAPRRRERGPGEAPAPLNRAAGACLLIGGSRPRPCRWRAWQQRAHWGASLRGRVLGEFRGCLFLR